MPQMPLQPGELAPDFSLPAVHTNGSVALGDYRGRSAVLLGFFRGLSCPFCRRQIAQLGAIQNKLIETGVEPLGIITTPVTRARLYARFRPARLALAADENADTHRAFGLPRFTVIENGGEEPRWPHSIGLPQLAELRVNPGGELPKPMPMEEAAAAMHQIDGFVPDDEDIKSMDAHWNQLVGLFIVDRTGLVRWSYIEAWDDVRDVGSFPSEAELLDAAAHLVTA